MRRIVVVGGGVCGLHTAIQLEEATRGRQHVELVLVDDSPHFLDKTHLARLAGGEVHAHRAAQSFRELLDLDTVHFVRDRVVGIETKKERIELAEAGFMRFDALAVTLGVSNAPDPAVVPDPNDVVSVGDLEDALRLRSRLVSDTLGKHVIIIGGGCVGVELAGSLASGQSPDAPLSITLLEAAPRLLQRFDGQLSGLALRHLVDAGVDVRLQTSVERVEGNVVTLGDDSEVHADHIVWCGGTRPIDVLAQSDLPTREDGRIDVTDELRLDGNHGEVYAGGDIAYTAIGTNPTPQNLAVAFAQSEIIRKNMVAGMIGRSRARYEWNPGSELVHVGGGHVIGATKGVHLASPVAYAMRQASMGRVLPSANQRVGLMGEVGSDLLNWRAKLGRRFLGGRK